MTKKKLYIAIVIILHINQIKCCKPPNFQHLTTYTPNKQLYNENEAINIQCENNNIDLAQTQICKNEQWTGGEPICGKPTKNHRFDSNNVKLNVYETSQNKEVSWKFEISDQENIGNRCYIFLKERTLLGNGQEYVISLTLKDKFNINMVRLQYYYPKVDGSKTLFSLNGPQTRCNQINKVINSNSKWPNYKAQYPDCVDCQVSPYWFDCAENSGRNINITLEAKLYKALWGIDIYIVEPYEKEVSSPSSRMTTHISTITKEITTIATTTTTLKPTTPKPTTTTPTTTAVTPTTTTTNETIATNSTTEVLITPNAINIKKCNFKGEYNGVGNWPSVQIGEMSKVFCPQGKGYAVWKCMDNGKFDENGPDFTQCIN